MKKNRRQKSSVAAPAPVAAPPAPPLRHGVALAAAVIALACLAVYSNSFNNPFVFDDIGSITTNKTIRAWPPLAALSPPPGGETVSGRPLLNLGLALNYHFADARPAKSGSGGAMDLGPRGFHAANLAIHILAALLLLGVVRRTLLSPKLRGRFGAVALPAAFAAAFVWAMHPLQTESVTYIVQRAESQVSLFYLLTLYCFIRGAETRARGWFAASAAACCCGALSKEVMVSAPLLVLLYDWIFTEGPAGRGIGRALKARAVYYAALFSSWILLAALILGAKGRGGTVGVTKEATPLVYLRIQAWAIMQYLKLTVWPHPLILDYGVSKSVTADPGDKLQMTLGFVLLGAAFVWTVRGILKRNAAAWAMLVFFAVLAPSSSFIPVLSEAIAEHRMYLPLAPLAALAAVFACARFGRAGLAACLCAGLALGAVAHARNRDYRSETAIWEDTLTKRRNNPRALTGLGDTLVKEGRFQEGEALINEALGLETVNGAEPSPALLRSLGMAYSLGGQYEKAVPWFLEALKKLPDDGVTNSNLGATYNNLGNDAEALPYVKKAVAIDPDNPDFQFNAALVVAKTVSLPASLPYFEAAIRLKPDFAEAERNYGVALYAMGRGDDALAHSKKALALEPGNVATMTATATMLFKMGKLEDAAALYARVLKAAPDNHEARVNAELVREAIAQRAAAAGGKP